MLLFFLLVFFLGAIISPWVVQISKRFCGLCLAIIPFFILGWLLVTGESIQQGLTIQNELEYLPHLGVSLSFRLDELSYLFLVLIAFVGGLIMIYSSFYFDNSRQLRYFFPLFFAFTFSMSGLVLADNVIIMFVFWELTTICSYLLIGFNRKKPDSIKAAWKSLVITGIGGFLVLAGFLMIGHLAGTYSFGEINQDYRQDKSLLFPLLLVVIGAFSKSAQFPFHTWLPSAMKAPTPVSAFLHSATMVQAGIYLLFRLLPVISQFPGLKTLMIVVGLITMTMGSFFSVGHNDLKKILAYATIGVLGMVVFMIGMDSAVSLTAGVEFVLLHGFYKGGMFLLAGIIDKKYGTRNIIDLHGIMRTSPVLGVSALLLFGSCVGIYPFLGFFGKELVYQSGFESETLKEILILALFISNSCLVASGIMVGVKPFLGKKMVGVKIVEIHPVFNLAPLILGISGFMGGLFILSITRYLEKIPARLKDGVTYEVEYWHGIDKVLIISLLTIASGVFLYRYRKLLESVCHKIESLAWLNADIMYQKGFAGFLNFSRKVAIWSQHGYIRWYIFICTLFFLILGGVFVKELSISNEILKFQPQKEFYIYFIAGVLLLSGLVSITSKETLMAIAALGGVGYSLALIFVFLGAPDLAMTQFGIETLTVILFVLTVYKLPKMHHYSSFPVKGLDLLVSIAFGVIITFSVLMVGGADVLSPDSSYFVDNSLKMAHGKNIVNTILVDFRALDTLGEIFVIATAGLGVYILLRYK